MKLDKDNSIGYMQYQDLIMTTYTDACNAAASYFELDKVKDSRLDKRLNALQEHYDDLVLWRFVELKGEIPDELIPTTTNELDQLINFISTINPVQPIKFKGV